MNLGCHQQEWLYPFPSSSSYNQNWKTIHSGKSTFWNEGEVRLEVLSTMVLKLLNRC